MAAPVMQQASTGFTDAGGAWTFTNDLQTSLALVIVQILQDGSTNGAVTVTGNANINDLAGSPGWTQIPGLNGDGSHRVGGTGQARQFLYIGRNDGGGGSLISGGNSTSEDLYVRFYSFVNASAGTTLATVIENITAGSTRTGSGTTATVNDSDVTTLGPDRLACNFVAINDDNAMTAFTGQTGGTWAEAVAEYAEASGTDGSIGLQVAEMASAGTIDGGSFTQADGTDGWGVTGFAIIGTTVAETLVLEQGYVNFNDPGVY